MSSISNNLKSEIIPKVDGTLQNPIRKLRQTSRSLIMKLPIEILDYIFNFLTARKDQNAASLVCKEWKGLLNPVNGVDMIFRKFLRGYNNKTEFTTQHTCMKFCAYVHDLCIDKLNLRNLQKVNFNLPKTLPDALAIYGKNLEAHALITSSDTIKSAKRSGSESQKKEIKKLDAFDIYLAYLVLIYRAYNRQLTLCSKNPFYVKICANATNRIMRQGLNTAVPIALAELKD